MTVKAIRAALYTRVSDRDQNPDMQERELTAFCLARGWALTLFEDKITGSARERPGLKGLMAAVRSRTVDVVVVWKFDRFARSLSHLLLALEEFKALGVDFVSLHDPVDTTTPMGKCMFQIIGAFAELERSFCSQRVTAGMMAAKARGIHVGRPFLLSASQAQAAMDAAGGSKRRAAKDLGVSVKTLRYALRRGAERALETPVENGGLSVDQLPLPVGSET